MAFVLIRPVYVLSGVRFWAARSFVYLCGYRNWFPLPTKQNTASWKILFFLLK